MEEPHKIIFIFPGIPAYGNVYRPENVALWSAVQLLINYCQEKFN
jgi:hypothetical protein